MALEYANVSGIYRSIIDNSSADSENEPIIAPLIGSVEFAPSVEYVHLDNGDVLGLDTVTVELDGKGRPESNGIPSVMLLSPLSQGINPSRWHYIVRMRLRTKDGTPVRIPEFSITPPPGPYSLNSSTPIPSGNMTVVTRGLSAYEVAVADGFTGTVTEWLDSLKGTGGGGGESTPGPAGPPNEVAIGEVTTLPPGSSATASITGDAPAQQLNLGLPAGRDGRDGQDGQDGAKGLSAFELAVANGFAGTQPQWLDSLRGADGQGGRSAYDLAVESGFTGTLAEWLESLRGADGRDGRDGVDGGAGTPAVTPLSAPLAILRASASVAKAANRQVTFAFAGSSSTAGHNTAAAKRWVNLLAARLSANPVLTDQQAYDQRAALPGGVTIVNAGLNGATSATYLSDGRDTRIAALNPAVVVHMIGSNDFGSNMAQTAYRDNILAAIARIDSLAATPPVHLLIHSYERYDITATNRTWAQYGDTLRAIAAERPQRIAFLDLSTAFRAIGIPSTDPLGLMQSDKLHMNDYGHAYFAELISAALLTDPLVVPGSTPSNPENPGTPVTGPLVQDDFARADGPLGTTPVGSKPWLYSAGTMSIVNGLVTASAGNAGAFVESGTSDGVVGVTGSLTSQGLIFRASSTGEGYYFMWSGGGQEYRVGRRSALGAFTAISGTGTARTFAANARYEVELNGPSIKCKVNGTTVLEITDSTYNGTHHGVVSASTTGAPLKDFRVTAP